MKKRKRPFSDILAQIAAQNGVSTDEAMREMRASIDAAWDTTDPKARAKQRRMFPLGKPSPETFIRVVAKQAKN